MWNFMRSFLIRLALTIALLVGAISSQAEEVPPETITSDGYITNTWPVSNLCDNTIHFQTIQDSQSYCQPIVQSYPTNFYGVKDDWFIYDQTSNSTTYRFTYYTNSSQTSSTAMHVTSVKVQNVEFKVCPSTHPYSVSTDSQTGEPILCTDLNPSCLIGAIIGSQTLSESGQETACIPNNDGSGSYCSYQKKTAMDVTFQPYTYYENTGQECSSLDPDVIDNPYGMDEPGEWPQPDLGCNAISPTEQSCPADPAEHCQNFDMVEICDSGCGWLQDEFVCISTMNNDNQDGDSELDDTPNNDTDNDGLADELGVLKDIDKNTDELEKIGRDQLRHLGNAVDKLGKLVEKEAGGGSSSACEDCAKSEDLDSTEYEITNELGTFDSTYWDQDLADAQEELELLYGSIQTEFNQMFGEVNQSAGGLPVYSITLPGGTTKQIDLSQYEAQLAFLGSAILFLFMIFAVFIVLD